MNFVHNSQISSTYTLASPLQAISTSIDLKNDQNETSFYTAAVMELNAPGDQYSDPHDIVDANLDEYLRWIEEASQQGVDILVFPEAALNYNG